MTDQDLLHALRSSRIPRADAYARLLDAYGEELYRRCILVLRDRDAAHVVLRDTLIAARAHIGRLEEPEQLGEWLHALAEAECARRLASGLRTAAPVGMSMPERTALVPVRVLNGMSGPELDGYRAHVAARADHFDRNGFPVRPDGPLRLRGVVALAPVALAVVCALLLVAFAGFVLARDHAPESAPGEAIPQSRR
ncbi:MULTISPECIES: sigma-70 family RNA polymerase sigma factor [Nocardiopsidaceae]|jgi:DNA-directed RNA polymerase specialized sigma24 family protein|uniref:Sigma-70 family RNA polymerase sigma factor n=2 Tax=Nocardiopsidaceae TaxID=83676 RepID=A0ABY6YLF0_9ACTN|nr:sigma-70 family RNA polymerase sigma factor [Streptomonospora nanhaiensis]WAE73081.1 sigma-70 family RNA polymerase sigma factor [Streptomonospora nanhaiensis]